MTEEFHYIIARNWTEYPHVKSLCVYSLCGEVHYGTVEDARMTLEHLRSTAKDKHRDSYKIYKMNLEVIQ